MFILTQSFKYYVKDRDESSPRKNGVISLASGRFVNIGWG